MRGTAVAVVLTIVAVGCAASGEAVDQAVTTTPSSATTTTTAPTATMEPPSTTAAADATSTTDVLQIAEGVVIAVEGNLETVDQFTLRLPDGSDQTFVPAEDAAFDHGPMSHIRNHLASGVPVRVEYIVNADDTLLVLNARDA